MCISMLFRYLAQLRATRRDLYPPKIQPLSLAHAITFNFRLHIAIKSTLDRAHKLPAFNSFVIAIAWLQLAPDNLQKIK